MATVTDQDVAIITLHELHDILSSGSINVETEDGIVLPSSFQLADGELPFEGMDPVTPGNIATIMTKLNALRNEIGKLDSLFHDEFDGAYC